MESGGGAEVGGGELIPGAESIGRVRARLVYGVALKPTQWLTSIVSPTIGEIVCRLV